MDADILATVINALRLADGALERCYDEMDPRDWQGPPAVRAQVLAAINAVAAALPIAEGMGAAPWPNWPSKPALQTSRVAAELMQALGGVGSDESLRITVARAIGALQRSTPS